MVRFKDDSTSEFEKFIDAFSGQAKFQKNIEELNYWMDTIGKNGALDRYFRLEGGKVKAVPVERSKLRLYCYRINEEILIWAGGGQKTTRTFEEDPKLDFQVNIIRQVGEQLNQRMNRGSITKQDQRLIGNLEFEIEL